MWIKKIFKGKQQEENENSQYENECGSITFSDMRPEHMKTVVLGKCTPETRHLVVDGGLNLRGICRNQNCNVFEKSVWVQVGYGTHHINELVYNAPCPICKKDLPAETVLSLGYTRAIVQANGKLQNEAEKKSWEPPRETQGKFIMFEGYDGATSQWQYLKLIVTKP